MKRSPTDGSQRQLLRLFNRRRQQRTPTVTASTIEELASINNGSNVVPPGVKQNIPGDPITHASKTTPLRQSQVAARLRAQDKLNKAAANLKAAMSKHPKKYQSLDAWEFPQRDSIDSIQVSAEKLGIAIDKLVSDRVRLTSNSQLQTVKKIVMKWFNALFPALKNGLSPFVGSMPSPYSLVANGVLFILQIVHDSGQRAAMVEEILSFLSIAVDRIHVTEGFSDVLNQTHLEVVYCSALNLLAAVVECLAIIITYLTSSIRIPKLNAIPLTLDSVSNIMDALEGKEDFVNAKQKIDDATGEYTASMGYLTATVSVAIMRHDIEEKRRRILQWLWSGDCWQRHKELRDLRIEDTGKWVLEDVKSWVDGNGPIVCHGMRSPCFEYADIHMLSRRWEIIYYSSIVIDTLLPLTNNLNSLKIGVIQFYFDYDDSKRQTVSAVLTNLLKQLLYQLDTLPPKIEEIYDQYIRGGMYVGPDTRQFAELLIDFSKQYFKSVFILIDAMDECLESHRSEMLSYFRLLSEAGIRIYLTSRSHLLDEIVGKLGESRIMEIRAQDHDVEKYLIETLEIKAAHVKPALKTSIAKRIVSQADGKFLLAEFQLRFVLDKHAPREMDDALRSLPVDLADAYEGIIRRIENRASGVKTIALRALFWIYHAAMPIKMDELCEFLIIRKGDMDIQDMYRIQPQFVLDACESLVIYDRESGIVRFTHYTVREFLREYDFKSSFSLAETCLTYLTFDVFDDGPVEEEATLKLRILKYKGSRYVALSWGFHCRENISPDVEAAALAFLTNENKRNSMLQMVKYFKRQDITFTKAQALLHVVAGEGLTMLFSRILYGWPSSAETYIIWVGTELTERNGTSVTLLKSEGDISLKDENGETALHYAASGGHKDIVSLLLKRGAEIDGKNERGETALHVAAINGHLATVITLLEGGVDVHVRGNDGETPLHYAVIAHVDIVAALVNGGADINARANNGETPLHFTMRSWNDISRKEVVVELLNRGADMDSRDNDGCTPLHKAGKSISKSGNLVPSVMELLDRGADIHARDHKGLTPLHWAAGRGFRGNVPLVMALLDRGANICARNDKGETPLHTATICYLGGNTSVVTALLDRGANINAQDNGGDTSLHSAASKQYEESLAVLLDRGANIDAQNNERETPLHLSAKWGHDDITALLLKANADVDAIDNRGETPLHSAVRWGKKNSVVLLLDKRADINAKDNKGKTALHLAVARGDTDIVEMLWDRQADVDAKNKKGKTPLHLAAARGRTNIVMGLLDRGANITMGDNQGKVPLHSAAAHGKTDIIYVLLDRGSDVNASDGQGRTALHEAARQGKDAVVALMQRGADVGATDNEGCTPLHSAAETGNEDILVALMDRGADVNVNNNLKQTPLSLAVQRNHGSNGLVMALLDRGADVSIIDHKGWMPLHYIAERGDKELGMMVLHNFEFGQSKPSKIQNESLSPALPSSVFSKVINKEVEFLSSLISHYPNDYIYPLILGNILWKQGECFQAIVFYERSIGLDPSNTGVTRIEDIQHGEVSCRNCEQRLVGIRYRCLMCDDFDLCNPCYIKPVSHECPMCTKFQLCLSCEFSEGSSHKFLSIPSDNWNVSSV